MQRFIRDNGVQSSALAVTRAQKLVYAKGFGPLKANAGSPVVPSTPFRIASLSKPFTSVAVLQLAERHKLALDDPIFKFLRSNPRLAQSKIVDPRWDRVTIRNCLQHTSGMDRDASGDPIVMLDEIRQALRIDYPIPPEAVVQFSLGRRLDFNPGDKYAYSNVGYLILGCVIQAVSGQTYDAYVQSEVCRPVGITGMRLARALPENRPPEEVAYFDADHRTGPCVYPPKVGRSVPLADGGYNIEGYQAHGGWIASAIDLVRFAAAFDDPKNCPLLSADSIQTMFQRPQGKPGLEPTGKPSATYYGCGWSVRPVRNGKNSTWHTGLLIPGSSTLLVRRWDGLNWAVLFNSDHGTRGTHLADAIDPLVHQAADSVRSWPAVELLPTVPR